MSTSAFQGQHDNEEVLLVFRQHPMVMRKALIFGLFAILLAVLPFDFPQIYAYHWLSSILTKVIIAVPLIVIGVWIWAWIGWYYSIYIATNQRLMVIKQKGLFNRQVSEWNIDAIQNVNYHVNGFQAVIFGFGDITAQTYLGDLSMPKIHHPVKIHEQLVTIVRENANGSTPRAVSGSMD